MNLVPFQFENHSIRVVTDEQGEPWFVAVDVCAVLDIGNPSQAIGRLDGDESSSFQMSHPQNPEKTIIVNAVSESGLYSLVLGSRKPEAKVFKRWITSEVLPSIRKTGQYTAAPLKTPTTAEMFLQSAQVLMEHERRLDALGEEQKRQAQELASLKAQLPAPTTHLSIKAYANLIGAKVNNQAASSLGRRAAVMSRLNNRPIGTTPDDQYGVVNAYDLEILETVFESAGAVIHQLPAREQ